jgi:hypothetical protein
MSLRPFTVAALLLLVLAAPSRARAQDLGPLVSDFNAAGVPRPPDRCRHGCPGHPPGSACAQAARDLKDASIHVYKAANGIVELPYRDQNWIYGYYDYAYGRGPLVTLGSKALVPGFRGYGIWGSPGYGAGQRPVSFVDLEVLGGCFYPEARRLKPRWP